MSVLVHSNLTSASIVGNDGYAVSGATLHNGELHAAMQERYHPKCAGSFPRRKPRGAEELVPRDRIQRPLRLLQTELRRRSESEGPGNIQYRFTDCQNAGFHSCACADVRCSAATDTDEGGEKDGAVGEGTLYLGPVSRSGDL